jgi:hypothetical protein
MKSFNVKNTFPIVLLLTISLTSIFSSKLKIQNPNAPLGASPPSTASTSAPGSELLKVFETLFTDPTRKDYKCPCKKTKEQLQASKVKITEDGAVWSAPQKKTNYFEKHKMGWEASAYFFDYLDDVLQKDIINEFNRIFIEAQKIVPEPTYKDPYTLESILGINNFAGNQVPSQDELIKKIQAINPGFNLEMWKSSISSGQMNKIIKEWGWDLNMAQSDAGKYIVDTYDFNGDGKLNAREFIIAMIINNKKVIEGVKKCRNCMETIIMSKIDPIFMYLDCGNEDAISSESLWGGLQKLKRSTNGYNLFNCALQGGKYRTSSVNDFIIKAHKLMDGRITKDEFRAGILLGYWDRHTDESKGIVLDDSKNLKKLRWGGDGNVDIICERINNGINSAKAF